MSAVNAVSTVSVPDEKGESRVALGRRGEDLAVEHLRRQGLVILERNWRCREGELDILATDGRTLRRLTLRWLASRRVAWCPLRFDVIAIECSPKEPPRLRHVVGAF